MPKPHTSLIKRFLKRESAGGTLLILATGLAIVLANTPLNGYYQQLLSIPMAIHIGPFNIAKSLLLWINEGLMTLFFILVGLELKREFMEGEFADKRNLILPSAGALGGMVVPVLIYLYFNLHDDMAMRGWAIPIATDIAFALGVLVLLGSRVPISIKVFLTSLAILDDIGAIVIIAVFYTSSLSISALSIVAFCILLLALLNKCGVNTKTAYILVGFVLWGAMLKSGVHATLAGVILAAFIPLGSNTKVSLLKRLEHDLYALVVLFVLPVFAFANAGINFSGIGVAQMFHNVPVGIALGLFVGKQVGIFGVCWLFITLKISKFPTGMNWLSLYGTAALCGIGFTMSLFIGALSFDPSVVDLLFDERLGIILGSLASGLVGYTVLNISLPYRGAVKPPANKKNR